MNISCNKEDYVSINNDPEHQCYILFENNNARPNGIYLYNDQMQIIRINYDSTGSQYRSYDYNVSGTLISSEYLDNNHALYFTYEFNDNDLLENISLYYLNNPDELISYTEYHYNSANMFLRRNNYSESYTELYSYDLYEYENNNISMVYSYLADNDSLIWQIEYGYDDKNNPDFLQDIYKNFHRRRNITKYIFTSGDGIISKSSSYNSSFEYNEYDYPIKEIRNYYNGFEVIYEYEYTCID